MGFLRLSATINPHFNRAGSCLFFFPGSSSASFHTFLAPPRLSFLHLSSSSSLRLLFDGFFVRSCHVCVHRCCFKPPLYSSPRHFLRPRFLSAACCCRCMEILAFTYYPHPVKLLSLAAGSRAAHGKRVGSFEGDAGTTEVETPSPFPCSFRLPAQSARLAMIFRTKWNLCLHHHVIKAIKAHLHVAMLFTF